MGERGISLHPVSYILLCVSEFQQSPIRVMGYSIGARFILPGPESVVKVGARAFFLMGSVNNKLTTIGQPRNGMVIVWRDICYC